jgi:hypothetical protein
MSGTERDGSARDGAAEDGAAEDKEALELLRAQRGRLADRMRWPWWYQAGLGIMYALVFAFPFIVRYLSPGFRIWPFLLVVLAVACLMQWGLTRTTGIKVGFRNLSYPPAGRPVRIAIVVVSLAAIMTEHYLLDCGLLVAAIGLAVVALVAEMALQQAQLRGIRQELRGGGGAA